jgi:phospholipase C
MRKGSLLLILVALIVTACTRTMTAPPSPPATGDEAAEPANRGARGIEKLDHLIFLVMENRSFDHYFGTYPGADGIPKKVCVPHPALGNRCMTPFHDTDQIDQGGPHTQIASRTDVNRGQMDGFIRAALYAGENPCIPDPKGPTCADRVGPQGQPEVMAYHNRHEIPNYWSYADDYVLQDHMYAPTDSWTLPSHLFLVSAWSAICKDHGDPMSCRSSLGSPVGMLEVPTAKGDTPYAWTDITYLLDKAGVSWNYFVAPGPTCYLEACDLPRNQDKTSGYQNPMPGFLTVKENGSQAKVTPYTRYFAATESGDLPSVSWVMPALYQSDHPGHSSISDGQAFVTEVVNAAMEGPDWDSTAIFITWDDWGGFYDHEQPIRIDENGYGIRVPGLMISPYAKEGLIDHQTLSFDAYLKLIEDRFLGGQRLDPNTDGRPDPRPTVRESAPQLGDLTSEFDFSQAPREGAVLDPVPAAPVSARVLATEEVASPYDDRSPAIAADDNGHVYQLTTRSGADPACGRCPTTFIALRRSTDGGKTWLPDEYLCRCRGGKNQYDPVVQVDDKGRVFVNWLEAYEPGVMFSRSDDFGATWTAPRAIARPSVSWSNKPWFAISADGEDVYEYLDGEPRGAPYAVVSHDAGDTWGTPVPLPYQKSPGPSYYWPVWTSGAAVLPDGTALSAQSMYRHDYHQGRVMIYVYRSTDGGKTFTRLSLGSAPRGPICPKGSGCTTGYFASQTAMASDAQGNAYVLYNAGSRSYGPGRVYFRRSTDGGLTWSVREQLSNAPRGTIHTFPMLVAKGDGTIGAAWMDDRTGKWNTWYRQSDDGGRTWAAGQRLSDRADGRRYKTEAGFQFPHGDYGMLAMGDGEVWATWGESLRYDGPGGAWFTHRALG